MGLDMMLFKANKQVGIKDRDYLLTLNYEDGEEIAYWRKANMVHRWIYKNCALKGQNDDEFILVTKYKIKELLLTAYRVKNSIELVEGDVQMGSRFENGKFVPIIERGKVIKDNAICKKLLPTQEGFFFGNLGYNEYYAEDIDLTIENLENVLSNVNWKEEFVYYYASY